MAQLTLALVCEDLDGQIDAAKASIASVLDVSEQCAADSIDGTVPDALVLLHNRGDLFAIEVVDRAADRAHKLKGIEVKPGDRYLELVSTVAAHGNADIVRVAHGWPILSVVARTNTVAEAGGVASAPGGGLAA